MMNYLFNGKRFCCTGYLVPDLNITLLSIRQHMQYPGCYFLAKDNVVTLAYPKCCLYPTTLHEFELTIEPASTVDLTRTRYRQTAVTDRQTHGT